MLTARNLCKRYGDVVALDGVDLDVAPGEIVGFLGPNGAGKTTTMRAIMQLVELDGGAVTWRGDRIDAATRRRFGYMPAERGMYPRMRVGEHLVYYARLSGMDKPAARRAADEWLERLGLTERRDGTVQDLSSGNQQRVQLALALLNRPELLVLDEPFSGLDPVAVDVLGDVLREQVRQGAALLLSSHQLDLVADTCSSVVIVDEGRVVLRGGVEQIRADADRRYARVGFVAPTDWAPEHANSSIVARDDHWVTVRVPDTVTPDELLADAARAGTVSTFSYAPPDLSEVFLHAVGRADDRVDA